MKCFDHPWGMYSKLKKCPDVAKSSLTVCRHMDDNTLLKVLEQLLHKIKVNRQREKMGCEDGWNGVLVADFLLQQSLDANAVPSKATDRQWGREPRIENLSSVLISEGKVLYSCLA